MALLAAKSTLISGVGTVRSSRVRCAFVRSQACVRASAANEAFSNARDGAVASSSRRCLLVGTAMLPILATVPVVTAGENGYKKFLGYSQAPDLYLGYGQAKDAAPMYSFEYPADWEEDNPTKTEKSTM
eukprot:GHUV01010355.1.p1 GENE.GHUV01010355.1~~GHUV01010355.1.p1  ORF type:complete len:129 (+),score=6.01 GHUV01010355.1:485-871(+)